MLHNWGNCSLANQMRHVMLYLTKYISLKSVAFIYPFNQEEKLTYEGFFCLSLNAIHNLTSSLSLTDSSVLSCPTRSWRASASSTLLASCPGPSREWVEVRLSKERGFEVFVAKFQYIAQLKFNFIQTGLQYLFNMCLFNEEIISPLVPRENSQCASICLLLQKRRRFC